MTVDDILEEINKADSFLVLSHENPDGDAIGSSLSMMLALKNMGKDVDLVIKEYPENFSFLPGTELIKNFPEKKEYDVAIAVDCADIKRINSIYLEYFENSKVKIQFDHHTKNTMFADYNFVNPVSPACCQILSTVFDYMNVEKTKDIITCLLTGIITDTGGFRNTNISTDSFDFASFALSNGINVSKIYNQVLMVMTKERFEAEKLAMQRMEFFEEGKITFTYITNEDKKKIGTKVGDLDGIVEIGKKIKGVEVSIFIYEREDDFKISLRSNSYADVSEICMMFGGGGHIRAAACNMATTLEEAKKKIITETKKHI
ncbi:MAG: bifunctional oligoribonuclease/PAP phosphatase NrnA [Candidatus Scatovivens sp.]